jgi:hypothetical protein
MQQKQQAAAQLKADEAFNKKIYNILGDPKLDQKVANFQAQNNMIKNMQGNIDAIQGLPGETDRLREELGRLKNVPAGADPFSWRPPEKLTARQKLSEGWKGFKGGVKKAPGKMFDWSAGKKGPFGGLHGEGDWGFWGFPNKRGWRKDTGRARGGSIRRLQGGGSILQDRMISMPTSTSQFGLDSAPSIAGSTNLMSMTPMDSLMTGTNVPNIDLGVSAAVMKNLGAGGANPAYAFGGPVNPMLESRSMMGRRIGNHPLVAGTGDEDSVPALLSDGEFVVSKKGVKAVGLNALKQANSGQTDALMSATSPFSGMGGWSQGSDFGGWAGGGRVRRFAQGGLVGESTSLNMSTSLGGPEEGISSVNQNLVALIQAVENVSSTVETSNENAGGSSPRGDAGGRGKQVSNNISITVNVAKGGGGGDSSSDAEETSTENDGTGGPQNEEDDRKEQEDNRRLAMMMEAKIMEVILREQRPGGTLEG